MNKNYFIIALAASLMLTACGSASEKNTQMTTEESSQAESADTVAEDTSESSDEPEESSALQSESSEEPESSAAEKKKEKTKSDSSKASKEKNDTNTTIYINDQTTANTTTDQGGTATYSNDDTTKQDNSKQQSQDNSTKKLFENALENVSVEIGDESIVETGTVNGQYYKFTIDLTKWEKYTTTEDMVQLSRLFWQCYPRMYERYGDITDPPVDVILAIENEGYEVAEAGGDFVHLHDQWLYNNPGDYDCIVHELAHIIQAYWDKNFLEYDSYIELFADVNRMEYAMDNGYYNDSVWTLQNVYWEDEIKSSVRFFLWLDYMYSKGDTDIMRRFCSICYNQDYSPDEWDKAWQEIFEGTGLEGKTVNEAWEMYKESDFSYLSSYADKGETSELLQAYDIRGKLKH